MHLPGRWTVQVDDETRRPLRVVGGTGRVRVIPVVPCDSAAIERGARAVSLLEEAVEKPTFEDIATTVLRAAGETR